CQRAHWNDDSDFVGVLMLREEHHRQDARLFSIAIQFPKLDVAGSIPSSRFSNQRVPTSLSRLHPMHRTHTGLEWAHTGISTSSICNVQFLLLARALSRVIPNAGSGMIVEFARNRLATAPPVTSPSPCLACPSPRNNSAPGSNTGSITVTPAPIPL